MAWTVTERHLGRPVLQDFVGVLFYMLGVLQLMLNVPLFQESCLATSRTAFSMCTGAMTAEMARMCLQQAVTATDFPMDIQTVALWAVTLRFLYRPSRI